MISKPGNLGPETLFLVQHCTVLIRTSVIYYHILYISQVCVGWSVCVCVCVCVKEGIQDSEVGPQAA